MTPNRTLKGRVVRRQLFQISFSTLILVVNISSIQVYSFDTSCPIIVLKSYTTCYSCSNVLSSQYIVSERQGMAVSFNI